MFAGLILADLLLADLLLADLMLVNIGALSFELVAVDLFVLQKILFELGVFLKLNLQQRLPAVLAVRKRMFLLLILLLLNLLPLAPLPTPLSLPANHLIALPQCGDHLPDFLTVGTNLLVDFELVLFEVMEAIVFAGGHEVDNFGFVFAAVDVEDKFFLGEDVGAVEGAADLFLLC